MKQLLLFTLLPGLLACQSNTDVMPVSPASTVVGTYQTNGFMDYQFLTRPASQMPTVMIHATTQSNVTIIIAQTLPRVVIQTITGVTLLQQADQRVDLVQMGNVIGSVQTGRAFTTSGMETQGRLLRLSMPATTFTGYRP